MGSPAGRTQGPLFRTSTAQGPVRPVTILSGHSRIRVWIPVWVSAQSSNTQNVSTAQHYNTALFLDLKGRNMI